MKLNVKQNKKKIGGGGVGLGDGGIRLVSGAASDF